MSKWISQVPRILLVSWVLLVSAGLNADTITLRNGRRISGSIVSQTAVSVRIVDQRGKTHSLNKRSIRGIRYGKAIRRAAATRRKKRPRRPKAKSNPGPPHVPAADSARREPVTRGQLVARSAILPGWGFVKLERARIGYMYGALFFGSAAAAISIRNTALSRRRNYRAFVAPSLFLSRGGPASPPVLHAFLSSDAFAGYKQGVARSNRALSFTGIVYLFQLAHILLAAPSQSPGVLSQRPIAGPGSPAVHGENIRPGPKVLFSYSITLSWAAHSNGVVQ